MTTIIHRYSDCRCKGGSIAATDDEGITCPCCREDLGLPQIAQSDLELEKRDHERWKANCAQADDENARLRAVLGKAAEVIDGADHNIGILTELAARLRKESSL